jgi:hypothetical protein
MWRCLNGNHVRLWVFLCCCIVLLHALYLVLAEQAPVQLHRKKRTTESCHRTLQRHSPLVACCMTTDHVCSERLLYLLLASSVPPDALGSELGPTGLMYKASKTCMASTPALRRQREMPGNPLYPARASLVVWVPCTVAPYVTWLFNGNVLHALQAWRRANAISDARAEPVRAAFQACRAAS